jgi:predicted alpha/beta-hydrolase family hydrolase
MDDVLPLTLQVDAQTAVSALLQAPAGACAGCVLAHGAGAGMQHDFMSQTAAGLAARGVATLRFQFPFMERGSRRVDPPAIAQAAVRAAVAEAARRRPGMPWFAGGKSFGGRMSSQAQAAAALDGVRGLVFVGFPLHAAGKPSRTRAEHLAAVALPMLFLQGTRDELADAALIAEVVGELAPRARLHWVDDADHAFHVRARSGRTDAQALAEMLDATVAWMQATLAG